MRALLFILLFLTLLITPSAAENVTIEVFETSDVYYISLDDGDLIACPDDECIVDITNYTTNITTTELDLSRDDMKKIAQYVSLELNNVDLSSAGGINETFLITSLGNSREQTCDIIGARVIDSLMPQVEKMDELEQKNKELENTVATLQEKGRLYDNQLIKDNEIIEIYKEDANDAKTVAVACIFVALLLGLTGTPGGKGFLEFLIQRFNRKG